MKKSIEKIVQRVRKVDSQIVRVCRDLVRIPSENPPGDTTRVFNYVEKLLNRWDFSVRVLKPAPGRHNLIATWNSGRPGRHLILNGHLDVFPAGPRHLWDRDPFSGDIADGRIYGRGTTDMKAGVTASLFTLRHLRDFETDLAGKVTLVLVCDEETFGEHGARFVIEHHPECLGDAMILGEPGMATRIVRIGDKGLMWAEVTFRTPGGHSAYPFNSLNAVYQATRFVHEAKAIEKWKSPLPRRLARHLTDVERFVDRELGKGATKAAREYIVNPGLIGGGIKVNMIPPECTVQVDARIPIGGRARKVVNALTKAAKSLGGELTVINSVEPSLNRWDDDISNLAKQALERISGKKAVFGVGLGCNDGRLWRYRGVPAVVFGPTPHNRGRANEYVEIEDLLLVNMVHGAAALEFLRRR